MRKIFLFIILSLIFNSYHSQVSNSEQNSSKDKVIKPVGKLRPFATLSYKTLENRVEYMKSNWAAYCLNGAIYSNGCQAVHYSIHLAMIDSAYASDGVIFTLKMTDNILYVFMFHNLCNDKAETNGRVNVTFFNYTYGEVDAKSIKTYDVTKKRLFLPNNIFTEEMNIGNLKFIIQDKSAYKKISFAGKEFEINAISAPFSK